MVLHEDDVRARAARVAGRADLENIRTVRLSAEMLRDPQSQVPLAYDATPNVSVEATETGNAFTVTIGFEVQVHQRSEAAAEDIEDIAKVSLTLTAFYSLDSGGLEEKPFTDDELRCFAESSGIFALYPYLREAVATMTTRLGLPALTIPLLKAPLIEETPTTPEVASQAEK